MLKVTTFSDEKLSDLEVQLNDFFVAATNSIDLIDVKYAIAHESVCTDTETGVYSHMAYTAMVIYNQKKHFDF